MRFRDQGGTGGATPFGPMTAPTAQEITASLFAGYHVDNSISYRDSNREYGDQGEDDDGLSDREAEIVAWQGYADDMKVRTPAH